MKTGFRDTLDYILKVFGMRTRDTIGTVVSGGKLPHEFQLELRKLGYRVERGLDQPNYDFVILTKGQSTISNIKRALTKVDNGCIIIFRAYGELGTISMWNYLSKHLGLHIYEFDNNKFFGVIVKGIRNESKP